MLTWHDQEKLIDRLSRSEYINILYTVEFKQQSKYSLYQMLSSSCLYEKARHKYIYGTICRCRNKYKCSFHKHNLTYLDDLSTPSWCHWVQMKQKKSTGTFQRSSLVLAEVKDEGQLTATPYESQCCQERCRRHHDNEGGPVLPRDAN